MMQIQQAVADLPERISREGGEGSEADLPVLTDSSGEGGDATRVAACDAATDTGQTPAPALSPFSVSAFQCVSVSPVADVARYLETRRPVAHFRDEEGLWLKVPSALASETRAWLAAFELAEIYVRGGKNQPALSVAAACERARRNVVFAHWNWSAKTFRNRYDQWRRQKDWLVCLNRAKAGAEWWSDTTRGLPSAFLRFVKTRIAGFGRRDGMRQAILSIHAQWRTGANHKGVLEWIPGYESEWEDRNRSMLPAGWSYDNIVAQLNKRDRLTKATRAALHESIAAATQHLPHVLRTRANLRFLEEITFDDLRFDYLIFNPESGEAEELWALIARDEATRMVLGGVLFPAGVREDGSRCHLGARQMKELAGQMLQTYPLPPYPMRWVLERGTAGIDEAVRQAMGELFGHRITFSITSMLGGNSPVGYAEKAKGNSRGKASHESHNRLYHTQGSFLPGQTGAEYALRPADLTARIDECKRIAADAKLLPAHLRSDVKYPLLTLAEARAFFRKFSLEQNFRTDHAIEGFAEVLEWLGGTGVSPVVSGVAPETISALPDASGATPAATGGTHCPTQQWRDRSELPEGVDPRSVQWRKRMERPVERALRLIQGVRGWKKASPKVVVAFLEHSQRAETINERGELKISIEGRLVFFRHGGVPLPPGTEVLAYFDANEPAYVHLTDGRGAVLGTWLRRERVSDKNALAEALRYTSAMKQAALDEAARLAAPRREELEALRAHNASLSEFIEITTPPESRETEAVSSGIGEGLTAVSVAVKQDVVERQEQRTATGRRAARAILATDEDEEESTESAQPSAGSKLLAALGGGGRNADADADL